MWEDEGEHEGVLLKMTGIWDQLEADWVCYTDGCNIRLANIS